MYSFLVCRNVQSFIIMDMWNGVEDDTDYDLGLLDDDFLEDHEKVWYGTEDDTDDDGLVDVEFIGNHEKDDESSTETLSQVSLDRICLDEQEGVRGHSHNIAMEGATCVSAARSSQGSHFVPPRDLVDDTEMCNLVNFLKTCDDNYKITKDDPKYASIARDAEMIVKQAFANLDPRFSANIIPSGSFYEDLKVESPDEFDFMAQIKSLSSPGAIDLVPSDRSGFVHVTVLDSDTMSLWKDCMAFVCEHKHRREDCRTCKAVDDLHDDFGLDDHDEYGIDFYDPYDDYLYEDDNYDTSSESGTPPSNNQTNIVEGKGTIVLGPEKFQSAFRAEINKAMVKLKLPEGWHHGGYRGPRYSGHRRHGPATLFQFVYKNEQVKYKISLDITLCIGLPLPFDARKLNFHAYNRMDKSNPVHILLKNTLIDGPGMHLIPLYSKLHTRTGYFGHKNSWRVSCSLNEREILTRFSSGDPDSVPHRSIRLIKWLRDKFLADEKQPTKHKKKKKNKHDKHENKTHRGENGEVKTANDDEPSEPIQKPDIPATAAIRDESCNNTDQGSSSDQESGRIEGPSEQDETCQTVQQSESGVNFQSEGEKTNSKSGLPNNGALGFGKTESASSSKLEASDSGKNWDHIKAQNKARRPETPIANASYSTTQKWLSNFYEIFPSHFDEESVEISSLFTSTQGEDRNLAEDELEFYKDPGILKFKYEGQEVDSMSPSAFSKEYYGAKNYVSSIEIKTFIMCMIEKCPEHSGWSEALIPDIIVSVFQKIREMYRNRMYLQNFFFEVPVCSPLAENTRQTAVIKLDKLIEMLTEGEWKSVISNQKVDEMWKSQKLDL